MLQDRTDRQLGTGPRSDEHRGSHSVWTPSASGCVDCRERLESGRTNVVSSVDFSDLDLSVLVNLAILDLGPSSRAPRRSGGRDIWKLGVFVARQPRCFEKIMHTEEKNAEEGKRGETSRIRRRNSRCDDALVFSLTLAFIIQGIVSPISPSPSQSLPTLLDEKIGSLFLM